jgi:hypothetical protein
MSKLMKQQPEMYFDDLPESIKTIVRDSLEYHYNVDTFSADFEDIECKSRDGFWAASHNKGGLIYRGFTDIMMIQGSGCFPNHGKARAEIESQVQYHYDCIAESIYDQFKALIDSKGLNKSHCYYHEMYEQSLKYPELSKVLSEIEEAETCGIEDNTIMFELRFMYHGMVNGVHSASISAAVNTEGPYHRSSISWMPGKFCEGAKEIEITWRSDKSFETKLNTALRKCVSEVF